MINFNDYDAIIMDMDGVITRSAKTHAAAWKKMFDEYLQKKSAIENKNYQPFDQKNDYYEFVDGKPRYEGVASFLDSRGISIPYGSQQDSPDRETICGLGNRKNIYFLEKVKLEGVESYPDTVNFIGKMKNQNKALAAISSSRNAKQIMQSADVISLFDVIVDGTDLDKYDIKGKPEPDIFLEAAKRLNVTAENSIVIEDALAGVKAGKSGGFGIVIGVDRSGQNYELKNYGADIVVNNLSEILGD